MFEKERKPARAGVFDTVAAAQRAVSALQEAGFTSQEISVLCSDDAKERHFREFEHQEPAGALSNKALNIAGAGIMGLGGATVLTTVLSEGAAIFAIGAFSGLAAGGVFTALMATRGFEKEAADYYDQAVQHGKLMVTVEDYGADADLRLRNAARILEEAGADSFPLSEG
ncbi:MAG: general stress protein [Planctomycetaceae bacterium]